MEEVKKLQEERTQLFKDVYDGKQPKRVPIEINITWDAAIEYAEMDLKESQWNFDAYEQFFDKLCQDFIADKLPIAMSYRHPLNYQILGSKAFVMSAAGCMQHPEVHCMEPEEYEDLIADPYKFMADVLLPRLFTALNTEDFYSALTFTKAYRAKMDSSAKMRALALMMGERYGYSTLSPGPMTVAPLDFLADQLRSFSGMARDLRRHGALVGEACQVILPHLLKVGVSPISSRYARTFIPLHMGPFLNEKQFSKFWWPSFEQLMKGLAEQGAGVKIFVEQDWMNRIDYLKKLENRVEMQFEYGDAKLIKEKVGKEHVVSGLFPVTMLQTASKQKCCDKAKELIDVLAPGGGYIFNTDKCLYSVKGNIGENLKAVLEVVKEYGVY